MTEKLLTYALGRGLEYYDMPVVRSIVREAANDDYRLSTVVLAITRSDPFQLNMKAAEAEQVAVRESGPALATVPAIPQGELVQ